jgi:hypothetical protein
MKRINTIKRFAAAIIFAAVTRTGAAGYTPQVLSEVWMAKMDADQDGKVSQGEYVAFATDHLKKSRKPVDQKDLLEKFNGYDWNRDGFITEEDPLSQDPIAVFLENIKGSWSCENNAKGLASLTFIDDREAEVVRNGLSLRDESQGLLTYSIAHPGRNPVCMDISVAYGTPSEWHMKCIVEFLEENKIKMRVFMGSDGTPFPGGFVQGDDADTYYLTRAGSEEKPKPKAKVTPSSDPNVLKLFGLPVRTGR